MKSSNNIVKKVVLLLILGGGGEATYHLYLKWITVETNYYAMNRLVWYIIYIIAIFPIIYLCLFKNSCCIAKEGPQKSDWFFAGIFILVNFLSFNYLDIYVTANNSYTLIDYTLNGKLAQFYLTDSVYSLPTYIIYGIWNIPTYLINNFAKTEIINSGIYYTIFNLWNKVLPFLFALAFAHVTTQIAREAGGLKENKCRWLRYFIITSPIFIFVQVIFGQYDSFWVLFMMLGIRKLMTGDKMKFALYLSIAAAFKSTPLLIAIPILLLVEKQVLYILKYGLVILSFPAVFEILKAISPKSAFVSTFMDSMITIVMGIGFEHDFGFLSLFIIFFIIICVILFMVDISTFSKEKIYQIYIYIPIVIFSLMFGLTAYHIQWLILLVPFLVLGMFCRNNFSLQCWMDIVMGIMVVVLGIIMGSSVGVSEYMLSTGVWPVIHSGTVSMNRLQFLYTLAGHIDKSIYHSVLTGLFLAEIIIFYPKDFIPRKKEEIEELSRGLIWSRMLCLYVFCLPAIAFYFTQPIF